MTAHLGDPGATTELLHPPTEETWRLEDLFATEAEFLAARASFKSRLPEVARWRGRLGESAQVLAQALDFMADLSRELQRLMAYASMRSDADTRVAAALALRQEVELLFTEYGRSAAYVRPEILMLAPERLAAFLAEEPRLAPHGHFLRDLARQRQHVLSPPEERILAEASIIAGGSDTLFGVFQNAEMPFPEVTLASGESTRLTPANFARHRTTSVRADRERLFDAYLKAYRSFQNTLGHNLFEGIKGHVFRARARNYGSCLEAALDGDNIPVSVYRNLVSQIRERLPVLHRYFRLRARALGVPRLAYHDLHCPIAEGPRARYSVEQAAELVRESMGPLGDRYAEPLRRAFEERWIDWHPMPGKRSGAYASGSAYDVHPFMLLNFNGDYESVSTLAHEVGHAMHSHFSNRTQPYPTADYSICVAEVASTFNEAMLQESLMKRATDREEKLFLLSGQLDGFRATLFRQTMFAEFELQIHEKVERGESLTGEALSALYLELVRAYHAHDEGVCEVDERHAVEWAVVPHFHYNFYVYQYATGITAATALSEAVLAEEPGARDRYLRFLSAGGSDYPLQLLRDAGVDLTRPEPYQATMGAMSRALDRLEALLDERP
ncbi:MAG TPA: oligoendopeptidase F [Candidatus Polarisedimenticolaceae bacterium]|nr:oligoendopeptidase F [Candidatus Polarisedimenticolaceae bacterium]